MKLSAARNVSTLAPDGSVKEYHVKGVRLSAAFQAISFLCAFIISFAVIRGPNGEWPYAYWALLWVVLGIVQYFSFLNSYPTRVVIKNNSTIEFFNCYNKPLCGGESPFGSRYCTIGVGKGCFGENLAVFVRSEEHMAELKAQNKCCGGLTVCDTVCLRLRDPDAFKNDFVMVAKDVAASLPDDAVAGVA